MKTGFIGLGSMGKPMARNLAKAGWLDAVWNRTAAVALELAEELGVAQADTPGELAGRVELVLLCVSADTDVLAVVEALLPSLRPGMVVVDHSTVSADTARLVASQIQATGADFLDAPVTGGVEGAKNASLTLMVGGALATLQRVQAVLQAESSRIVHLGGVGAGQAAKAVNQLMCAGINQAVTEALAFGEALHLDMEKLIEALAGGAAGNWFLDKRGRTMVRGHYAPGFKLSLHHKDLRICQQMAGPDRPLPLAEKTLEDYTRLLALGLGEEDISALYRLKRPA